MSLLSHYENEARPWGTPERFTANEPTTVKILHVLPGKRFSLQKHTKRSEFWRVIEGSGIVTVGTEERPVRVGDEIEISAGTLHRAAAGAAGLAILEISFGEYDEQDIERIEDDFGRA
jgi:mannose-6-phosphate isomerase-like protein (cupin superfamily)